MMADRNAVLNRMASIEGHLRGVRKMIEEDAYCVDILKQTYAVQRAISALEQTLLRAHLSTCVPNGLADGRRDEVISELEDLFGLARR